MDLSALPESDNVFILQQLPPMNVPRTNHQLLHYRSCESGFEFLIALGGVRAKDSNGHGTGAPNSGQPVEFLDLQRLSNGWVLVDTEPCYLILESEAEHKFVLSGDSIFAFGSNLRGAHNRSVYTFDICFLTEQYNLQVIQLCNESSHLPDDASSPTVLTVSAERPRKLLVDGKRLWQSAGELEKWYTNPLFFATPII